jgi:hypothetical protein
MILAKPFLRLAMMVLGPGPLRLRLVKLGHELRGGERRPRYFT